MPVKTTFLFFFLLCAAFCFSAHAQVNVARKTLAEKKFAHKMRKKNAVVMDVRTIEEYQAGHLPGALHLDVLQEPGFNQQIQALDKKKTYLLYCKSGRRSERALKILYANGYKKVYHLNGGYTAWHGDKE